MNHQNVHYIKWDVYSCPRKSYCLLHIFSFSTDHFQLYENSGCMKTGTNFQQNKLSKTGLNENGHTKTEV